MMTKKLFYGKDVFVLGSTHKGCHTICVGNMNDLRQEQAANDVMSSQTRAKTFREVASDSDVERMFTSDRHGDGIICSGFQEDTNGSGVVISDCEVESRSFIMIYVIDIVGMIVERTADVSSATFAGCYE